MRLRIGLTLLFACLAYPSFAADLWRPKGQPIFVDSNGHPYAGAKLCFFDAGTSNETTVYKDSGAQTAWVQPITLNSGGGLTDPIYVQAGEFKEKLMASTATDCTDTALYSSDEIPGAFDTSALSVDFAKPEMPVLNKATNYTLVPSDVGKVINVDATGGDVTITLPSAVTVGNGAMFSARKTDSSGNSVIFQAVGGQTIDGASTLSTSLPGQGATGVSDGANWYTLDRASLLASSVTSQVIQDGQVAFADLSTGTYDTDGTLSANSDSKLPTQKATKFYVDSVTATAVKWKDPVRVASTADATFASAFDNASTVDGVAIATNDRILIKNQSDATTNGIYIVQASGAPVLATDADANGEIPGATVFVSAGSTQANTQWTNTNTAVTLGVTNLTFSQISAVTGYSADGTSLLLTSTTFSIKDDGVTAGKIVADAVGSSEIAAGAVGTSEIATDGVAGAEIAAGAVDTGELATAPEARLRDVGEVITMSGTSCPAQSLEANGAAVSRVTYSAYFGVVSTLYGVGDNVNTFNLPDYRGRFLRGWDHAAGLDPDAASRTNAGGGTTGDNVGTKQADALEAHTHSITQRDTSDDQSVQTGSGAAADDSNQSSNTSSSGGNETRPANINVLYCVFVGA